MNSPDSSPAIGISNVSATHLNQSNRYGEPSPVYRLDAKAPIQEKLNNSPKNMVRRLWQVGAFSIGLFGLGMLWMQFSSIPITGPQATPFSVSVLVLTVLSVTLSGISLISGLILAALVGKLTRQIEQIQAGNYLVRWDLNERQWAKYIADEKQKSDEDVGTAIFVCVILGLLMWYPFSGIFSPILCVSGIIGLGYVGYLLGQVIVFIKKRRLERMADPQFTVVGHEGLYFQSGYYPYSSFGTGLSAVERKSTEAMEYLVFTFFNQTNNGRTEHERRVPIPTGKELEAEWVLKQFS